MILTDRAIQMFAKDLQIEPNDLRNQMENLDEQFRQSFARNDWMGCLAAIKKQNRLLGLCPIETESDEDDGVWL